MDEKAEPLLQHVLSEIQGEVSRPMRASASENHDPAPDEVIEALLQGKSESDSSNDQGLTGLDFPATKLQDRVTIMLLFVQIVEARHVNRAWKRCQQAKNQRELWRFLVDDPDLEAEKIYREAARLYSFEEAQIQKVHALSVMREISGTVGGEVWKKMKDLHIIPIDIENIEESQDPRLVFATHDPMRNSVHRFIESLDLRHFSLRFAPKQLIKVLLEGMNESGPTSLLEPEEMGLSGEEKTSPREKTFDRCETSDEQKKLETKGEEEVSRSTLVDLFETSLIEAVRRDADSVWLYPNASRQVEVLLHMDDHVTRWHVEDRVPPEVFLTVAKEKMRKRKSFSKNDFEDQLIQRWIDRKRVKFRVSSRSLTNSNRENLLSQIEIQRVR